MRHLFIVLLAALVGTNAIAEPRFYEKQYRGFTVWLDCTESLARRCPPYLSRRTKFSDAANVR